MSHATPTARGSQDAAKRPQPGQLAEQPDEPQSRSGCRRRAPARGGPPAVAGSADRTCARGSGARRRGRTAARRSLRRREVEGGCRRARAERRNRGFASPRRSSPAWPTSRPPPTSRRPVAIRVPRRCWTSAGAGSAGSGSGSGAGSSADAVSGSGIGVRLGGGVRPSARARPDPRQRRGAPVPGTPVRACVGLRTRAGSASSTCRTSCRTSCCRPSRGRTAGRRPRHSWWSRALPCAGRAACPPPVGGARRTAAGGCPTARSCRGRPAASRVRRGRVPYARLVASARAASACHGVRGPADPGCPPGPPGPPPTSCS